ncbi:MAG: hypothetical protein ABR529_06380 [Actinomycetota bacterium]
MATSLLQLVLMAAVGWAVGDLVVAGAFGADRLGLPERGLAATLGFFAFSVALMLGHLVSGGTLLALDPPVPIAAAAVLVSGWSRRVWPRHVPWVRLVATLVLLGALYVSPIVSGGSSLRGGDTPWHMGRTHQLLGGEPVPGGPAAAFDRNAYPWGFHALLATIVRLVPGSSVEAALTALGLFILLSFPLAAASLARLVEPRAGWTAAACGTLIGGFGWVLARGPVFYTSPDDARLGADLMTASPNGVYALFPPALPRELGLVLLAASAVLVVEASRRGGARPALIAGAAIGIVGLMSVPMLVNAGVWALAGALAAGGARARRLATMAAAAAAVFGLWAVPLAIDYVRFGGFVNVTPELGREWALTTALASWGLLLPLAAGGVVVAARDLRERARPLLAFAVAAALMMAVAIARARFDWELGGVPWLLHQGRMWPPAHLVAAALGGLALLRAYDLVRQRARALAVVGVAAVLAIGALSPRLASIALARTIERSTGGFVFTRADFAPDAFVRRAAEHLGPGDVVEAVGSETLDLYLFQYSGVRVANFEDRRLARNDARIRFSDLARRWDRRRANGGFDIDYSALPEARAPASSEVIARGLYHDEMYVLVAR